MKIPKILNPANLLALGLVSSCSTAHVNKINSPKETNNRTERQTILKEGCNINAHYDPGWGDEASTCFDKKRQEEARIVEQEELETDKLKQEFKRADDYYHFNKGANSISDPLASLVESMMPEIDINGNLNTDLNKRKAATNYMECLNKEVLDIGYCAKILPNRKKDTQVRETISLLSIHPNSSFGLKRNEMNLEDNIVSNSNNNDYCFKPPKTLNSSGGCY
ncbi:MAG: hypothetical protein HRT47_01235 [Candidatus Caenarcaniphilales bacterium]|nr:hypothetical protein [Candidatus Caenarcaniphilales bacterium]